jgi:hypothetical protein
MPKMVSTLVMITASVVNMVKRCKTRQRFICWKIDHGHCMKHLRCNRHSAGPFPQMKNITERGRYNHHCTWPKYKQYSKNQQHRSVHGLNFYLTLRNKTNITDMVMRSDLCHNTCLLSRSNWTDDVTAHTTSKNKQQPCRIVRGRGRTVHLGRNWPCFHEYGTAW